MKHDKFMLLAEARSGSTTLTKFFADLGVKIESEPQDGILSPFFIEKCFEEWDAIKYISTSPNLFRPLAHAAEAAELGIKLVVLSREQRADQAISLALNFMNEEEKGEAGRTEKREGGEYREWARGKRVEVAEIREWIGHLEHMELLFTSALEGHDAMFVRYEELYNRPWAETKAKLEDIFEFLSLTPPPRWEELGEKRFDPSGKETTEDTLASLANYKEIYEACR